MKKKKTINIPICPVNTVIFMMLNVQENVFIVGHTQWFTRRFSDSCVVGCIINDDSGVWSYSVRIIFTDLLGTDSAVHRYTVFYENSHIDL